jgi:hypothetical protein
VLLTCLTGTAAIAYQVGQTRKQPSLPSPVAPPAASPNPPAPAAASANDKLTRAIMTQLNERITMSFPQETPLEDVLKYIKSNTQSEELNLPSGITIYVDPLGLQQAEMTLATPVTLDLEGVPLRRTLTLVLNQVNMRYFVNDGVLFITSNPPGYKDPLSLITTTNEPTPLDILQSRAVRGELTATERKEYIELLKDLKEISKELRELEDTRRQQASPLPPSPGPQVSPPSGSPHAEKPRPK